ncbi:hypothetical protein PR202_gb08651 [Eleusine coracana subsp. coracana]|uniref:Helicase ATP-binding domain-containing protein n=1 Tax=Eleusine coracana subsp. coracana TaxID=191504 RepID=A0AAV5ECS6_ELECO|nr:hypothetical protein PR202_gb08651 [Eleusine coracana subsp. coracana]
MPQLIFATLEFKILNLNLNNRQRLNAKPGTVNIYVHYGQNRPKEASFIAQSDIVLTTYGVVASEFSTDGLTENGSLYAVHWFRVVLDEAHTIKSSKSSISLATAALTADRRWCLTGTPIQNNLEDLYSLFRFLRVEPWRNWPLWNKLVQKPYEEGDERGLKLVQSILKPIMLRRTKNSTDKEGRPILTLPPANIEVKYCDLSEAEKDFYEALFQRSKVKFDQFVEQGRVLHNYASILELLLRLRQCCDHPFLVMRMSMSKQDLITAPTNSRFRIDVDKNWVESSKISSLLQELEALRNSDQSCFLQDPWWNPAVEEQAIMRIHRIGQTKTVSIKRFIVKGTVEERMEAVQARKQRMISGALTDQEVRTARLEELKMLFS